MKLMMFSMVSVSPAFSASLPLFSFGSSVSFGAAVEDLLALGVLVGLA